MDFNAEFNTLLRAAMGNQPGPSWLKCELTTTRQASVMATVVQIEVTIVPHHRMVWGTMVAYQGHRVGVRRSLDERALHPNTAPNTLLEMLRELAPMLYEFDPRIGTDEVLERLPLFDPPASTVMRDHRQVPCRLCQRDGGHRMWGGGTLGWVHPECWSR